jgi:hypothetical protein
MDSAAKTPGEGPEASAKADPRFDQEHLSQEDLFNDVIAKIKYETLTREQQFEQLRRVLRWGTKRVERGPDRPPLLTIMYYMGRPIESYEHAELVEIAREGWASYHSALESATRSMRLMMDLHRASRR